jgi:hypothetical protein
MPRIPLAVSLASLESAREQELLHRPLFPGAPPEVPVVVLVEDDEPVTEERLEALGVEPDDAFADATEARGHDADGGWAAQAVPVKGGAKLALLVREGDNADVEDVLVPQILQEAATQLGAAALAVALPARGVLLATDAGQKWQLVAAFATAARMQHEQAGDEALWPGLLRVEKGRVVGVIELSTVSLDAAAARARGEP